MNNLLYKKILPPIIPYITISIGLLVFHNAWLAILGYHAGMIAILLLLKRGIAIKASIHSNSVWIPVFTALAGAGSGILLYLLWPFLSVPDGINSYILSIGLNKQTWPVFLAYFILVNPFIEEYYWRGCLAVVNKRMTLNDLLFSGYHLIVLAGWINVAWLGVVFVCLSLAAWFWRQMNRLNGGLLASTLSHAAADITVMLTIFCIATK